MTSWQSKATKIPSATLHGNHPNGFFPSPFPSHCLNHMKMLLSWGKSIFITKRKYIYILSFSQQCFRWNLKPVGHSIHMHVCCVDDDVASSGLQQVFSRQTKVTGNQKQKWTISKVIFWSWTTFVIVMAFSKPPAFQTSGPVCQAQL